MGNNKFRLSDMIPNAWFYKLKDMSKTRKQNNSRPTTKKKLTQFNSKTQQKPQLSHPTTTHPFFTNNTSFSPSNSRPHFPDPPRKSSKKIARRKAISIPHKHPRPEPPINFDDTIFKATKYRPKVKEESFRTKTRRESKSTNNNNNNVLGRKSSSGIKLSRVNSPKLASKKIQAYARKSISSSSSSTTRNYNKHLSESFAVVKSSVDPQSDFRESMAEMIVENNIRGTKDLEELLACYLSLNSKEYHDIIVKAFEQIWFDMAYIRIYWTTDALPNITIIMRHKKTSLVDLLDK
ncbi:hypothetical protein G4B88_015135, partial [Cannabis sativa]